MSPATPILLSMLALAALAIGLLWYLGTIRIPMIMRGEVKIREIALERGGWPEREKKVSNAFDNQFQLPVLFYLFAGLALWLGPSWFEALLAVLFVVLRYVHAFIHATSNHVIRRFWTYTAGLAVLSVLLLDLVVRVLLAAGQG
jgi:hypothetical protein